jgi:hypothetical protein
MPDLKRSALGLDTPGHEAFPIQKLEASLALKTTLFTPIS